jgi:hypothetical protein
VAGRVDLAQGDEGEGLRQGEGHEEAGGDREERGEEATLHRPDLFETGGPRPPASPRRARPRPLGAPSSLRRRLFRLRLRSHTLDRDLDLDLDRDPDRDPDPDPDLDLDRDPDPDPDLDRDPDPDLDLDLDPGFVPPAAPTIPSPARSASSAAAMRRAWAGRAWSWPRRWRRPWAR